jgi:hypothetical protein
MKKFLSLILSVAVFAGASAPALAGSPEDPAIQARINQMLAAVANGHQEVNLPADRYNTNLAEVMKWNNETREQAIDRMARALISVSGNVPKPQIPQGYGAAYDPAPHAFRQATSRSFYAGMNVETNQPVFVPEQRDVLLDSFWYCAPGLTYVYKGDVSVCE